MRLYKYFETLNFQQLKDDIYYFLGDFSDYKKIKDYYNLLNIDELRSIKNNPLVQKYRYVYNKLGIVDTHSIIDIDDLLNQRHLQKREIKGPYLFLIKEKEISTVKKYKKIDDLVNDENVGIYYVDSGLFRNIYCYNLISLKTLFFSNLTKQDKNAYNSWSISRAVSSPQVAGKNILYPIMAHFAGGIFSASRDSVKEAARYVWKDFYDDSSNLIKRYFPIDDFDFIITPDQEDDGVIFKKTKYDYDLILSILKDEINKMKSKDQKVFDELLLVDNKNDMQIVIDKNLNLENIKKLNSYLKIQRTIEFKVKDYCDNKDFIYYLLSFITKKIYTQLEAIDVLERIQESFLNWTYELKDNSIGPKVDILRKRHKEIYGNDSSSKDQIIEYADDLWEERYF